MLQPTHRWRGANTLRQCCDTAKWCHLIVDVRSIHNRIRQMPARVMYAFTGAVNVKVTVSALGCSIFWITIQSYSSDYRVIFSVSCKTISLLAFALVHIWSEMDNKINIQYKKRGHLAKGEMSFSTNTLWKVSKFDDDTSHTAFRSLMSTNANCMDFHRLQSSSKYIFLFFQTVKTYYLTDRPLQTENRGGNLA